MGTQPAYRADASNERKAALWLRRHSAGERRFAQKLAAYFTDQAGRVADQLADYAVITPALVPVIFNANAEHERLMRVVMPELLALMLTGARDELERHGRKDYADEVDWSDLAIELPDEVLMAVRRQLIELERQPYWQRIQTTTGENLTDLIVDGLDAGQSNYSISVAIREQLGGYSARKRAMVISRTESTGALNSGHNASMEALADEGLITGKEWLSIVDDRVRVSHELLNGVTVGNRELFDVGGTLAPYPGWHGLPAEQRIRCRCTIVAAFAGE